MTSKPISNDDLKHWIGQSKTHYSHLTEKEKDSDRVWAKKVLDVLGLKPDSDYFILSKPQMVTQKDTEVRK